MSSHGLKKPGKYAIGDLYYPRMSPKNGITCSGSIVPQLTKQISTVVLLGARHRGYKDITLLAGEES